MTNLESRLPLVYLITDRHRLGPSGVESQSSRLVRFLGEAMACGVDMVQLREPDLPARELFLLTKAAAEIAARFCCSLLVNDRADIAVACAAGVHLTTRSVRPSVVRRTFGSGLLMGVSTHNIDEVREAEDAGANFVVFGPVYETETKKRYGPPVGPGSLQDVASRSGIPVLALGGINEANFREALKAGAAGIAGISMFADSTDLKALVTRVKSKE